MKRLIVTTLFGLLSVVFISSSVYAQSVSTASSSSAASVPLDLTVGPGEKLVLQLDTPLHTGSTRHGDRAYFKTSDEVMAGGVVAIPRGSEVRATVTHVRRPGRLAGRAEMRLRFDDVRLPDGTILPLEASVVRAGYTEIKTSKDGDQALKGDGGNGSSLTIVGQGGMQGAILGATLGGGKGALYGGAAGAAIGLATIMMQRGPDLDLPRDMLFELKFDKAFQVPAAIAQQAAQIARSVPVAPPVSSTGNYPTTVGNFPADPSAAPVPDFSRDNEPEPPPAENGTVDVASTGRTTPPVVLPAPGTSGGSQPTVEEADNADDFKLKVDVQLVMVDATVRDRSGRPMETLRREDFRVFENGLEQTVQSFSRDEYPLAVALVVDRSGSVAPYMNELRQAAYRALHQLKRGDQVCLFTFAGDVQRLEDLTTDRQRIANRIGTIQAGGGTNIVDGLFDAVYYLSLVARDRRRVVILVSDNENSTRPRSSQNEVIRMAMESETVIYSVKTVGGGTPLTMRVPVWVGSLGKDDLVGKIAHETGGEIIDAGSTGSLDSALATVITRLKLRYTLGYNSPNSAKDGSFRKIDVRLNERYGRPDSDYVISARRGYYAGSERVAQTNRP